MNSPSSSLIYQHEKFSSQLQLSQKKISEGDSYKSEVKPSEAAAAPVSEGATAKAPEVSRAEDKATGEPEHLGRRRCSAVISLAVLFFAFFLFSVLLSSFFFMLLLHSRH